MELISFSYLNMLIIVVITNKDKTFERWIDLSPFDLSQGSKSVPIILPYDSYSFFFFFYNIITLNSYWIFLKNEYRRLLCFVNSCSEEVIAAVRYCRSHMNQQGRTFSKMPWIYLSTFLWFRRIWFLCAMDIIFVNKL